MREIISVILVSLSRLNGIFRLCPCFFNPKTICKSLNICALVMLLLMFNAIGQRQFLCAATVVKTISGQAVLTDGVEKARKESISDALGEALVNYIYADMATNHKFEQQIDELILKNRNLYINKFVIQSEHTLGELYQIELRVELKSELIERDLKKIEQSKQRVVEQLTLVVLPPGSRAKIDSSENSNSEGASFAPIIEPTVLELELKQGLAVYGFTLTGSGEFSEELELMFMKLMEADAISRSDFKASWFEGLLAGDLIVAIRPTEVREEHIVSLHKSFWHSQADIVFIDMKNDTIIHLPTVGAKVISADYVAGMERLTQELSSKIQESTIVRLLRDYVVPGGSEEQFILKCVGFRQPVDVIAFKERLNSLRTVKEVFLSGLAAGSVELEIRTLTTPLLLERWLNDFTFTDLPFRLSATKFSEPSATVEVNPAAEFFVASPTHFLVQVIYGAPDDI